MFSLFIVKSGNKQASMSLKRKILCLTIFSQVIWKGLKVKILKPYVEEEIWIFFKKKNSVVWVIMMYSKEFKL